MRFFLYAPVINARLMPNREACISMNLQHAVETAGVECRKLLKGKSRQGEAEVEAQEKISRQ